MQSQTGHNSFVNSCIFATSFSVFLIIIALLVYFLLPVKSEEIIEVPVEVSQVQEDDFEDELNPAFQDYFAEISLSQDSNTDDGLTLYRQALSRSAVEWFYYQITGNRSVAQAILTEAEKNDIPLSLAFALAHTESSYNTKAVNRNSNSTTDRGLFQLNSNSFTNLTEEDFFDPFISAKYGMSHLKFCLNTAGNEVSALAMYNAGTGRVRSNRTPQSTLNYVGKIMSYQKMLDQLFSEQIVAYFETQLVSGVTVAYLSDSKR